MNNKYFEYKNYYGSCEVCLDSQELFGKILFIRDLVTYAGDNICELESEFKLAVDDYLETCVDLGKKPDESLTGNFDIRLGCQLHKKVALAAMNAEESQNEVIKKAVSYYFNEQLSKKVNKSTGTPIISKNKVA
ncbi:MAG: toxin-antitoxin system HicB family antitoxin [Methylococcaceae bacterium]|nr:toxin-antitoxin system HicB family antitoxin [Methylococcaceae bacterium]